MRYCVGLSVAVDLILVFDRDRLVEQGTHASLLRHDGLHANIYDRQFRPVDARPVVVAD
jgi:ABC-type multidrug transport system fused ATPase/permease subunit